MELKFKAERWRRLALEPGYTAGFSPAVVTAYRKRIQVLRAAPREQALFALSAWLRMEKPTDTSAHHSMRVTDEWQLLLEFENGQKERVAIIAAMVQLERTP